VVELYVGMSNSTYVLQLGLMKWLIRITPRLYTLKTATGRKNNGVTNVYRCL